VRAEYWPKTCLYQAGAPTGAKEKLKKMKKEVDVLPRLGQKSPLTMQNSFF
jgi:hypothetical protein